MCHGIFCIQYLEGNRFESLRLEGKRNALEWAKGMLSRLLGLDPNVVSQKVLSRQRKCVSLLEKAALDDVLHDQKAALLDGVLDQLSTSQGRSVRTPQHSSAIAYSTMC